MVVSGQQDEIAARFGESLADGGVPSTGVREVTPLEHTARDLVPVRDLERPNLRSVGDDQRRLDGSQTSVATGAEHGLQVRASPGYQDAEAHVWRLA